MSRVSDQNALDRRVARYLADLEQALGDLPAAQRSDIIEEIADHIREARARLQTEDEASLRQILDRLGDAATIRTAVGAPPQPILRRIDRFVPWILLLGGFIFAFGWVVGVILLWSSPTWRRGDKVLGTLVVPGGLSTFILLGGLLMVPGFTLPEFWGLTLLVVGIAATIATSFHLDRVRRRVAST